MWRPLAQCNPPTPSEVGGCMQSKEGGGRNATAAKSESSDPIGAPRDREKYLSAAYLSLLGHTQAEAAMAAGVDARTLGSWESCSW